MTRNSGWVRLKELAMMAAFFAVMGHAVIRCAIATDLFGRIRSSPFHSVSPIERGPNSFCEPVRVFYLIAAARI